MQSKAANIAYNFDCVASQQLNALCKEVRTILYLRQVFVDIDDGCEKQNLDKTASTIRKPTNRIQNADVCCSVLRTCAVLWLYPCVNTEWLLTITWDIVETA